MTSMPAIPGGLIISAPASGTGKTTVTLGLLAAFRAAGLTVQPFKSGPDYIDPAFHTAASGRVSVNLDTWAMPEARIAGLITAAAGKEVAYVDLPEADYAAALVGAGLPEGFAKILADSDAWAAKGALQSESKDLSTLLGHPTEPMEGTLRRALA